MGQLQAEVSLCCGGGQHHSLLLRHHGGTCRQLVGRSGGQTQIAVMGGEVTDVLPSQIALKNDLVTGGVAAAVRVVADAHIAQTNFAVGLQCGLNIGRLSGCVAAVGNVASVDSSIFNLEAAAWSRAVNRQFDLNIGQILACQTTCEAYQVGISGVQRHVDRPDGSQCCIQCCLNLGCRCTQNQAGRGVGGSAYFQAEGKTARGGARLYQHALGFP